MLLLSSSVSTSSGGPVSPSPGFGTQPSSYTCKNAYFRFWRRLSNVQIRTFWAKLWESSCECVWGLSVSWTCIFTTEGKVTLHHILLYYFNVKYCSSPAVSPLSFCFGIYLFQCGQSTSSVGKGQLHAASLNICNAKMMECELLCFCASVCLCVCVSQCEKPSSTFMIPDKSKYCYGNERRKHLHLNTGTS